MILRVRRLSLHLMLFGFRHSLLCKLEESEVFGIVLGLGLTGAIHTRVSQLSRKPYLSSGQ